MLPMATASAYQRKSHREPDLGDVTDKEREDALATCKCVSPKLSDSLIHLSILHWSYLMPHRLSRYRPEHSS